MRKELYIKIKKNFVNFLFLGISLFLFITMLISNDSYQGPYYYVRLSFSDLLSAILSIILILGIIFCDNKIIKLKLTLILVFFLAKDQSRLMFRKVMLFKHRKYLKTI